MVELGEKEEMRRLAKGFFRVVGRRHRGQTTDKQANKQMRCFSNPRSLASLQPPTSLEWVVYRTCDPSSTRPCKPRSKWWFEASRASSEYLSSSLDVFPDHFVISIVVLVVSPPRISTIHRSPTIRPLAQHPRSRRAKNGRIIVPVLILIVQHGYKPTRSSESATPGIPSRSSSLPITSSSFKAWYSS